MNGSGRLALTVEALLAALLVCTWLDDHRPRGLPLEHYCALRGLRGSTGRFLVDEVCARTPPAAQAWCAIASWRTRSLALEVAGKRLMSKVSPRPTPTGVRGLGGPRTRSSDTGDGAHCGYPKTDRA